MGRSWDKSKVCIPCPRSNMNVCSQGNTMMGRTRDNWGVPGAADLFVGLAHVYGVHSNSGHTMGNTKVDRELGMCL